MTLYNSLGWRIIMRKKFSIDEFYVRHESDAIGHSILLISDIASSSTVQAIVNVFFPAYSSIHFARNPTLTAGYIFATVLYGLFLAASVYSNIRQNRIRHRAKELLRVNTELQDLIYHRMQSLDSKCNFFLENPDANIIDLESRTEANYLCEHIYRLLSDKYRYSELEVVLWRETNDGNGGIVAVPFSFGTLNKEPPKWMNSSFDEESKYRILDAFTKNEILFFMTRAECQEELTYAEEDAKKTSETCQYVAIPIRKRDGITSCVLQLRTFKEGVLPTDKGAISTMIRDLIYPSTTYYELVMDEDNMLEVMLYEDDNTQD